MRTFSFVHLLGNRKPKANEPPQDEEPEDRDTQPAGEGEPQDEEPEDQDNQPSSEDEPQDEEEEERQDAPAASALGAVIARARAEGRARERARIGTILSAEAAQGRLATALHLAVNTDMAAADALAILAVTPKGTTGSRLDQAMGRQPRPDVGAGSGREGRARTGLAAAIDTEIATLTRGTR